MLKGKVKEKVAKKVVNPLCEKGLRTLALER
jgi:hypothetical protein